MSVDWVTVSSLATAGGTLVLAFATFASVKSANRAARAAETSLLAGLRPLLMPSQPGDAEQKIGFADQHWLHVPGGGGSAEADEDDVYLALSLRNYGSGIAILDGWHFTPDRLLGVSEHPPLEDFRRLTRDIYIPAGDIGFWQGAFRDHDESLFDPAHACVTNRTPMTIDLLYGDHEGGQRVISRFSMQPTGDGSWLASVSRHWNIDRVDPRDH